MNIINCAPMRRCVLLAVVIGIVGCATEKGEPEISSDEQLELTGAAKASLGAAPCSPRGDGRWDCNNHVPAPIFDVPFSYGTPIDHLRTNPSWFECRGDYDYAGGGPHPYRWVATQGDDHGKWGWVRDIDIASETNPIRVCL